ncbi:hypothetical protein [Streptomyces sp. WM6386]|uniref:hypothetical protein n=1 Tax=Streptomyces sp. WM6386 TaxID=1415558 RepID=UPI00131D69EB|nr:hypothetical protein [Streptomyces sp. WM6386]
MDTALTLLRNVLARAPASLEAACEDLPSALLPGRPTDDIALLVARTRALDARHVATWDLTSDPTITAGARTYASDQLAAQGPEELSFTTELMVSEMVTNAIRYGKAHIQLRMILQSTLMCEVGQGHLGRARGARSVDAGGLTFRLPSLTSQSGR